MKIKQVLKNVFVEADRDGENAALIHQPYEYLASVAIPVSKRFRDGDQVKVTVELVKRRPE